MGVFLLFRVCAYKTMTQKQSIFSFEDDDDDDKVISSVQPLPRQAIERTAFTTKEFNPDAFLSSRRYLGLERLKSELNGHLKLLKTELVELINRDYQDFINLSTNLKGVDKEIEKLKLPLIQMETQVQVGSFSLRKKVAFFLLIY